ncbi:MAG: hypothetical protein LBS56_09415 [Propionibacteriaceae bacterium]|jgi:hypothetical protein|nr:hypothetical protein [Propionibacteriaceae bacterium]
MTVFDIQARAAAKNTELEHTCLRESFTTHWRIVALGDLFAGYSPFPDASLILPAYHAGQVLTRLKEYVTAPKERKAPIPLGMYLPFKGKKDVDYFDGCKASSLRAMANWLIASATACAPPLLALYRDVATDLAGWRTVLRTFSTVVSDGTGQRLLLWPNLYWGYQGTAGIHLASVDMTGRPGPPAQLDEFQPSVYAGMGRGVVPGFQTGFLAPAEEAIAEFHRPGLTSMPDLVVTDPVPFAYPADVHSSYASAPRGWPSGPLYKPGPS